MMALDKNESYWLRDKKLVRAARAFSTYPGYGELKRILVAYAGVAPGNAIVIPGS